jgi:hypothetical protein
MIKTSWFYLLAAFVVGGGSLFLYRHYQTTLNQTVVQAPTPSSTQVITAQPKQPDDDLNKKRQDGIGSIKSLKPVPIEPSSDKNRVK